MTNQHVRVSGPLFTSQVDSIVREAVFVEVLDKVEKRVMRKARSPRAGRKNNTLSSQRGTRGREQALRVSSTLNNPRTKGTKWVRYNAAVIQKLAPNALRAAGRRIAKELGGQ